MTDNKVLREQTMAIGSTRRLENALPTARSPIGATGIARWKNNKAAAFCLMFDDSIPSDVANVVPELKKRDLVGTFYVNPGGFGWGKDRKAWEKELPRVPQVVYANHTMTHKGARSKEQLAGELKQCNDVLYQVVPGKTPRLISYGRPGVKAEDWTVSDADEKQLLAQNHLIDRPPFGDHGAMIAMTTAQQMAKRVDDAIAAQRMDFIVFHGVGGDWIVTPLPIFTQFLDLLESRRDNLWLTDAVSVHKYETERDAAKVTAVSATPKQIQLRIQTKTDPALYDAPLTLACRIPEAWAVCEITGPNKQTTRATPQNGVVQFDAVPSDAVITVRPAKAR